MSTPTPAEKDNCKVELLESAKQGGSGWLLRDPRGLPLRRFYKRSSSKPATTRTSMSGRTTRDGVEVYREWAAKNGQAADHFRWMNAGGRQARRRPHQDGKIEHWQIISPEETSQEIVAAVATNDLRSPASVDDRRE